MARTVNVIRSLAGGVLIVMLAWWAVALEFPVFGVAAGVVAAGGVSIAIALGAPAWLMVLAAPMALTLCCAVLYSAWLIAATISPPDFP